MPAVYGNVGKCKNEKTPPYVSGYCIFDVVGEKTAGHLCIVVYCSVIQLNQTQQRRSLKFLAPSPEMPV